MTRAARAAAIALAACATACGRAEAAADAPEESTHATSSAHPVDVPELVLVVTPDGVVWAGGEPLLGDDAIEDRIAFFRQHVPQGVVRVHAAHAAVHGRLVRVLDLLAEAGAVPASVDEE